MLIRLQPDSEVMRSKSSTFTARWQSSFSEWRARKKSTEKDKMDQYMPPIPPAGGPAGAFSFSGIS